MIEPDMLERWDVETVEYCFFQCENCRKSTRPEAEWVDACGEAMDAGWRKIEGEVYCKDCIPLIIQRAEERESLIRRYNTLCECGHKSGRHWYAVEHGTASYDCRDCDCLNFILQKVNKTDS